MLACARLGAIHSVVFGGFAAPELAVRIDDARPKAIIAASCGHRAGPGRRLQAAGRRGDRAWRAHKPETRASCSSASRRAAELTARARPRLGTRRRQGAAPAACVPVGGMDPLYILYTSGTTGQPKGVVRANAGHMVALAWTMRNIYAVGAGRRVLGGLGRRLGGRAFLHLLRAADRRRDDHGLRGQAGRHAGRRHLLAGDRRARRAELLHRADRVPRDQARGSRRASSCGRYDLERAALPVPRRRARRSRHHRLGAGAARRCR